MSTHSQFSPSSAHRWMRCAASIALEDGLPDSSSEFADEGTAAHELAAMALTSGSDAAAYLGRVIEVNGRKFEVDFDMADNVQKYLTAIRERVKFLKSEGADVELRVEQRVEFGHLIGVPNQGGTADAQIIATWPDGNIDVETHDLKYGRGVRVDAEENEQLMLYSTGLVEELLLLGDVGDVTVAIHQPRLDHLSVWSFPASHLREFVERAENAAQVALIAVEHKSNWINTPSEAYYNPGTKQCMWCKAKATCPALAKKVLETVADDFVDIHDQLAPQLEGAEVEVLSLGNDKLAEKLELADLIEGWLSAVRARVESELFAGHPVPGFKLVQGRKGSRAWTDLEEAEKALKSMRLKEAEMYDMKLISPTTAEKLHKSGVIGQRQWPKLQSIITQSEGKPSVAPASDKRAPYVVTATQDDFSDETTSTADDLI